MENLCSIAERGILSNERASKLPHGSVAMDAVQERREKVRVPGALRLHQYANLYFNARNVMMYVRSGEHLRLGVVSVAVSAMDIEGVVIADRNAATYAVDFGTRDEIMPSLDHSTIFAERWDHGD